jgi:uncharacterized protein (UPF0335 family)
MSQVQGVSSQQLRQFIEQIEYLEEQKTAITGDIRDAFAEAKSQGFDVKALRQILKIRKMDKDELAEQEHMVQIYLQALSMVLPTYDGEIS